MSVKIMGAVWDAELPRPEKFVLLSYADHAAHDGTSIYPSVGRTAWKTGYSRRSVQTITRKLEKMGILVLVRHRNSGVKEYRLDVSKLPARAPYRGGANSAPPTDEGVQILHGGAQKTAGGGANSAPESSLTVKEPSDKDIDALDLWREISQSLAATMDSSTWQAHFATAVPTLSNGTLTVELSQRSLQSIERLRPRLIEMAATLHKTKLEFVGHSLVKANATTGK